MKGEYMIKIIKLMLLILALIHLISCSLVNTEKTLNNTSKRNLVLHHLKEKYEEDFEIHATSGAGLSYNYDSYQMTVLGKTETEDYFTAEAVAMNDGTYSISDNYFAVLMKPSFEKEMKRITELVFKDCKLDFIYAQYMTADHMNKIIPVNELADQKANFGVKTYILVNEASMEEKSVIEKLKDFEEVLIEHNINYNIILDVAYDEHFEKAEVFRNEGVHRTEYDSWIKYYGNSIHGSPKGTYLLYINHKKIELDD